MSTAAGLFHTKYGLNRLNTMLETSEEQAGNKQRRGKEAYDLYEQKG